MAARRGGLPVDYKNACGLPQQKNPPSSRRTAAARPCLRILSPDISLHSTAAVAVQGPGPGKPPASDQAFRTVRMTVASTYWTRLAILAGLTILALMNLLVFALTMRLYARGATAAPCLLMPMSRILILALVVGL